MLIYNIKILIKAYLLGYKQFKFIDKEQNIMMI